VPDIRQHRPHLLPRGVGLSAAGLVSAGKVQQSGAFPFDDCGDQQIGETYRSHAPAAPECGLDIKRAPPVLIMDGKPLVAGVPVDSQLAGFGAAAGSPAQFELDDTTGGYCSRLDQRGKHRGNLTGYRSGAAGLAGEPAIP
jgi:hypothetical protein